MPTTMPVIHRAILAGDRQQVLQLIATNNDVIYQRNPWEDLPIELAVYLEDKVITADLYEAWERLPASAQWAHNIFYRVANAASQLEGRHIEGDDPDIRKEKADKYLHQCLPGVSNTLAIYQAIENQDEQRE